MAIKKVWLDESAGECICCGACEGVCDAVFSVPEKMQVNESAAFAAAPAKAFAMQCSPFLKRCR